MLRLVKEVFDCFLYLFPEIFDQQAVDADMNHVDILPLEETLDKKVWDTTSLPIL